MPTVLDLLGVPAPAAVQGTSLRPALDGQRQELLAFSESWYPRFHYGWSELQAVRDGAFKFILAPTRELYDVGQGSRRADQPRRRAIRRRADRMERALRALVAQTTRAEAAKGPQAVDPAAEQRLRALGYVGSTSARAPGGSAAPRPQGHDRALQPAAAGRHRTRRPSATTTRPPRCCKALAVDPEMIEGYTRLGNIYTQGRPPRRGRRRLPEGAGARSRAPAVDLQPGAGLPRRRQDRRGHRRLRAHAAARSAQRPGALPARRHLHAARRSRPRRSRC